MWMMTSMVEKKLRKMGTKRMKMRVIGQYIGNEERNILQRGDREPQRVLKFDLQFSPGIYCD
jgi:hypothetical protein